MFSSNCIVKKYARNRKRAACMFFRSAKTRVLNTWLPVRRSRFLKAAFDELTIKKITRKVNAPNIRRLKSARPWLSIRRISSKWLTCLFNTRVYKTNYRTNEMTKLYKSHNYPTLELFQLRTSEYVERNVHYNFLKTSEISKIRRSNWVASAISPYERRYVGLHVHVHWTWLIVHVCNWI